MNTEADGREEIAMLDLLLKNCSRSAWMRAGLCALVLGAAGPTRAADVTFTLCATAGSATLPAAPAPVSVPVLGYVREACSPTSTVGAPGGPVLDVHVGDNVTVVLQNALPRPTGLLFQGQRMVPDTTGADAATSSAFGTKTYSFTPTAPGTYLYEAAPLLNAEHQPAMGLHGALVVRPSAAVALTGVTITPTGGPARTDAAATYSTGSTTVNDSAVSTADVGAAVSGDGIPTGTTIVSVVDATSFTLSAPVRAPAYGASTLYNDEAVLVLSEVDPALNTKADPSTFDMRGYAPRWFLINGQAYPSTAPIPSSGGSKVLLRYVNGGAKHHSMAVLGLRQVFVAKDGGLLPTMNHTVVAETLAPGQTGDALVTMPTVTAAARYPLYEGSLALHNNGSDSTLGGMLTFLASGAGAADTGPTARSVVLAPNPTNGTTAVALTATVASSASTVAAAEYFVDTTGAAGSGTAMAGTFGTASVDASATLTTTQLAALPAGRHTVYVRGRDANDKWGAFASAVLNLDKAGPTTSSLTLTPNPSNGSVPVTLRGTASDAASGNANVVAAEYFIGTAPGANGTGTPMTVAAASPVSGLSAALPCSTGTPCSSGTVHVHGRDALGNWGPFATIALNVVAAGPTVSAVTVTPNPNNGTVPLSASQPVVRVTATMTAATGSTVAGAEGFIDTVGATGSGFVLVPTDGAFNAATESGYADIPLTTVNGLATGSHTIFVRGRDATGTWGSTVGGTLLIDKTAPTLSAITLSQSTIAFGTASVGVTLTAADTGGAGLRGGQYWLDGTTTPPTNATAFTGTGFTLNTATLAGGNHNLRVRVQDAATNWSTVLSVPLVVVRAVNDTRTFTANPATSQTVDSSGNASLLQNDQPTGTAGRTASIASAPVRFQGTGAGTIAISCPAALGTAATPAISGNTVCTNGNYRITSTGASQAAKRGRFRFDYTETLNGVSSTATVTVIVN